MLSGSSDTGPTECHRTTRANIRSHLYGGPQGWNPHFFRTLISATMGHKPIGCRPGPRATPGGVNRIDIPVPSTLLHLTASERSGPPGANLTTRRGGWSPRPSHYLLMGVFYLSPSLDPRPVTRFHGGGRVTGYRAGRRDHAARGTGTIPVERPSGTPLGSSSQYINLSWRWSGGGRGAIDSRFGRRRAGGRPARRVGISRGWRPGGRPSRFAVGPAG